MMRVCPRQRERERERERERVAVNAAIPIKTTKVNTTVNTKLYVCIKKA
jgi:hypothetical protein